MRAGLSRVLSDVPLRHGYFDAMIGADSEVGAFGRIEAGYRPFENLGLFGFGEIDRIGWQVGAGARVMF